VRATTSPDLVLSMQIYRYSMNQGLSEVLSNPNIHHGAEMGSIYPSISMSQKAYLLGPVPNLTTIKK